MTPVATELLYDDALLAAGPVLYRASDDPCQQQNLFTMEAQFVACRARFLEAGTAA